MRWEGPREWVVQWVAGRTCQNAVGFKNPKPINAMKHI